MKINYDDLDEMYDNLPTRENVRKENASTNDLTDPWRAVLRPPKHMPKREKYAEMGRNRKREWDTGQYVDSDVWGMQLPPLLKLDRTR